MRKSSPIAINYEEDRSARTSLAVWMTAAFMPFLAILLATQTPIGNQPSLPMVAEASNWAQVSGNIQQNQVIPYYPAPNQPHWSARFGMASLISSSNNVSSLSHVYLLGGDSYDGHDTQEDHKPGLHDYRWEHGYKNDVWRMQGTEWFATSETHLRNDYGRKLPKVVSQLVWEPVTLGLHPPPGVTNDKWLRCEKFFRNLLGNTGDVDCSIPPAVQWSPRRHHSAVFFKGALWVLGGRAREFVVLPEERSIGGIVGPRVRDVPQTFNNRFQLFTTQREASVYKSDVWKSVDGANWQLVTPGCRAPQKSLIAAGFPGEGKYGLRQYACSSDSDCYGAESCDTDFGTCVCNMWSPREQHAVAVHGKYMYLTGGYASRLYSEFSNCGPYACGDTDASSYRFFLSDVWRSPDGERWEPITEEAFTVPGDPRFAVPLGRGGHQMLVVEDRSGDPFLWVIGGRGGDNSVNGGPEIYFNDIWTSPISNDGEPTIWTPLLVNDSRFGLVNSPNMPWSPRTGHAVALMKGTPSNGRVRTLFLYGGFANGTFYDDVWAWRLDEKDEFWRRDFMDEAFYSTGTGEDFRYRTKAPSVDYVTPDSNVTMMQRFWVPTDPGPKGEALERRVYMDSDRVHMLNSVGVYTIRDLAEMDLYTVLKLRGFDVPQVPLEERLTFTDVCDFRALAIAVVDKCDLNPPYLFDGEDKMPWNIVPNFGGPPPETDPVAWHGVANYDSLQPPVDDTEVLTAQWDGCTFNKAIQGLFGPNVNKLGYVDQVKKVRNPKREIQELFCRQTPQQRAWHNMLVFEERLYVMGGKQSEKSFWADTWYRDAQMPQARIRVKPETRDTYAWFHFVADEAGTYFEYRLWDPVNFEELREWTPVTAKTNVLWLDWREGGPGNGRYQLYVRAVDPAGNRDAQYVMEQNVYNWYYLSPTPYDIIFGTIAGFLFLCFLAYLEYRRRVKKAAMERYAMKRMRRKFKAMQRDINGRAVDWRTLYMESKQAEEAGLKKRDKNKKKRDKNAEKRDKEKKKREKEKELIKKKLKASKEHKEKLKAGGVSSISKTTSAVVKGKGGKGKRSQVKGEDGFGYDDMGLEEQLLLDQEAITTREGGKGGISIKPQAATVSKGKGKGKVAVGDGEEFDDVGEGYLLDDDPLGLGAGGLTSKDKGKGKVGGKAVDGTVAIAPDSSKEVAAGSLKASKDTELGTKQRRVNKRLKEYEAKDGGGNGGSSGNADSSRDGDTNLFKKNM